MSDQGRREGDVSAQRRWVRGTLGGVAGILVAGAVSFPLLLVVGPSTVFNEELQSPKLTAVWDVLEPAPLMMSDPTSFGLALALLGAAQGVVFVLVAPALSRGVVKRGLTYGLIVWLLSTLAFELLGPYNLLAEPVSLVAVELAVALPGNLVGGIALSAIYGGHRDQQADRRVRAAGQEA